MKEIQYSSTLVSTMSNFIKRVGKNLIIYSFFITVAIIFWHPVLFLGKFPWISDLSRQYYPWYLKLYQSLHSFSLPFWVSDMGMGYPLLAQGEVGVFYPINWILIFLFSPEFGFKLGFLVHSFIASVAMYHLGRALRLSKIASMFAAFVFSYSFFFTVRSIHPSIIASASYLPFGLVAIEKIFNNKSPWGGFWLSFVIAAQILAGHPQISFISIIFYASYFFLRLILSKKLKFTNAKLYIGVFLASIFFGIGISLVQIIPTVELATFSSRIKQSADFIFSYSLPRSQYLTYLFPYLFGISPANSNIGFTQFGGHYWEFALYIGILPFIFSLFGISMFLKNIKVRIFTMLFILFSILAVGGYLAPYRFIVRTFHLPFRVSARFLLPVTATLAILSGFGFDAFIKRKVLFKRVFSYLFFLLTTFLLFATIENIFARFPTFIFLKTFFRSIANALVFTEFQQIGIHDFSLENTSIFVPFIFILVSSMVIILFLKKKISLFLFIFVSFGLFFVDTYLQGFLYQQWIDTKIALKPPVFESELTKNDYSRFMTFTQPSTILVEKYTLQPNINLVWGISSFNSVTPLPLKNHDKLYAFLRDNRSYISVFGISHLISRNQLFDSGLELINKGTFSYLYKNKNVFPRVYMVYDYLVADNKSDVFSLLQKHREELDKTIILNKSVDILHSEEDKVKPKKYLIEKGKYTNQKALFNVETSSDGILVFLDSYYPSWRAFVDGVETDIMTANGFFRAIVVPKGSHVIEFRYQSKMFYIGLVLSVVSTTSFLVVVWQKAKRSKI